jgi:hypothetical protein
MMMSRRQLGASLAMVTIGLAACGGGGDGGGAAATTTATSPATTVSPTSTAQPVPSSTAPPVTTPAPITTQAPTTTPGSVTAQTLAAAVPLMPALTCSSEGANGSSPNTSAPLVCLDLVGRLRWAAVVQGDLSEETRAALSGCADELTSTITSIGPGEDVALPQCDAANSAVASAGSEPYLALIQEQLADCRLPLARYASDQQQGVDYDAPKAEALVNEMFDCKSVVEGFARTRP